MQPRRRVREILEKLEGQHPGAFTELHFRNPYELLVATILSAQCTDERVNRVTPALFQRYPDARALARATTAELEPQIQSTGFFRSKSKSLAGMANALVERHAGEVPARMDALVELPGVGRKTANVVLGHALGVPGLPVDRHVLRVANRIGIAESDDPVVVEDQLTSALPPEKWTLASDTLILHGRRICRPKPLCDRCAVAADCDYYHATQTLRAPRRQRRRDDSRKFRDAVQNLAIVVEDEPSADVLAEMEIEPGETLFGLYQGTPLTERAAGYGNALPDRITLYQFPIEDDCETDDEIVQCIGETLIHELGHYFGLSEDEIEEIEEKYWRGE